MAHHHPSSAVAECPRGEDVLLPLRDERVPARDARVRDPAREPDRDEHVEDARPEHGDDRDHEHEEREREEEIDDPHHRRVDPAAEVAGAETDRRSDQERHAGRAEGDQQVDAAAVEDSREDVAPERVGAEHVSGRERRRERTQRVDLVRVVAREQRRPDGGDDHEHEHRTTGDECSSAAEDAAAAVRAPLEHVEECDRGTDDAHSAATRGSSDAWTTSVSRLIRTTKKARTRVVPWTTG